LSFGIWISILDIMSSNEGGVQMQAATSSERRRVVGWLLVLTALQTLITVGHFAYGASLYNDPSREHVVLPAIGFLIGAAALGGLYLWRPHRWALWLFAAEVAIGDVGLFGGFHGGFNHALKDLLWLGGMGAERLRQIFESPDFVVPDNAIYEVSGLFGLIVALAIAHLLLRLVRGAGRPAVASCA
jgi:hypothetical protein